MKFIVSSAELQKRLQHVSGVLSTNTVLPILMDFLFEIEGNKLTVMGTDLETVVKVTLEVEAKEPGRICIPAKILLESLKNIPDQPLAFDIDASYTIEITSDTGKYQIMGEDPENFPKEPEATESSSFELSTTVMHAIINKCMFATSSDNLRPAMSGVFFELADNKLTTVATDAHRLVKLESADIPTQDDKEKSFIVPKKPLGIMRNLLPTGDETLNVSFSDKHLFVEHEGSEIICRLIDARYPDYKVVIPPQNPYKLIANKNDFQNALRRVSVFSNKSTYQTALNIAGNELQLESQDEDLNFKGNERMACQYDGEDMKISFNAKALIEMLGAMDGDEVALELSAPTKPGILKPVSEDKSKDLLMLIMPLMINA